MDAVCSKKKDFFGHSQILNVEGTIQMQVVQLCPHHTQTHILLSQTASILSLNLMELI